MSDPQETQDAKNCRKMKLIKYLRYDFTDAEIREFSQELARTVQEHRTVLNHKGRVMADFKAKLTQKEARIDELSGVVNTGYEFRDVECEVILNYPTIGQKQIRRLDTLEIVDTSDMEAHEMQENLDFDDDPEPGGQDDEADEPEDEEDEEAPDGKSKAAVA